MYFLRLSVPLPPTTNNAYFTARHRRVLTPAARAYKHETGWRVRQAALEQDWQAGQRYRLTLRFWLRYQPTARRKYDLSNHCKLLEDAIAESLGFDDSLIERVVLERAGVDTKQPRCDVELEVME